MTTSLTSYLTPTSARQARLYKLKRNSEKTPAQLARLKRQEAGIFNSRYIPELDNMAREQIAYGGSSSGKSYFYAQRDVLALMEGKRNILVCRNVARTSRKSTYAEMKAVISEWGWWDYFTKRDSELTLTCSNGCMAAFIGLDDVEKVKSIRPNNNLGWTDVRVEEATETSKSAITQLKKRQRGGDPNTPKRLTLTFNPIIRSHHIYTTYFEPVGWADNQTEYTSDDLTILKTTYKDNEFLTPGDVYDLENERDEYFYNVYTLGNWGVLGNVIFTRWRVEDLSERKFDNLRRGLDFGFVHPAAYVEAFPDFDTMTLYITAEVYVRQHTNEQLADVVSPLAGQGHIVADSAEPKSIAELQAAGLVVTGAVKGKDSITHGIQWLKRWTIVVDESCINMQNELSLYAWKKINMVRRFP